MNRKCAVVTWIICFVSLYCYCITPIAAHYGSNINMGSKSVYTNYEIREFYQAGNDIHIKGFFTPMQGEMVLNGNHRYTLNINGKMYRDVNDYNMDITVIDQKAGLGWCPSNTMPNRNDCNYKYQDVGFHFRIPITDLANKDFKESVPYIVYHSDRYNKDYIQKFTSALEPNTITSGNYQIYFDTNLNLSRFDVEVDRNSAMVRTKPYKSAAQLYLNGVGRFWDNTMYHHILGISNSDVGNWYKVNVQASGTKWVKEGASKEAWINTSFVRFIGSPTTLLSNERPTITGSDMRITVGRNLANTTFMKQNFFDGLTFFDREDSPSGTNAATSNVLSKQAKLERLVDAKGNAVTISAMSSVGSYTATYSTIDSNGFKSLMFSRQIIVEGNKAPTIMADDQYFFDTEDVTTACLLRGVQAMDKEDGNISNKIKIKMNNVINHKVGDYEIFYQVHDSQGLQAEKKVNIFIRDATIKETFTQRYIRSIDKKYMHTLIEHSKWKLNPILQALLLQTFDKKEAESLWKIESKDIEAIKKFNRTNDYSQASNALFLKRFINLKKE